MNIPRTFELNQLKKRLKTVPIVAILGPRQCGKTTLARQFSAEVKERTAFFDLENPQDLNRLQDPLTALKHLKGVVIIDEIQRQPELFPILRVLVDQPKAAKFIILGSASIELIRQSSESLAGRVSYIEMGGFSLAHIPKTKSNRLWIRGTFPRSYLAASEASSFQWRRDFISAFLERDIPNLGIKIPAKSLHTFWAMLAHFHAQIFNASEIGRSLSISDHTAQRYLDLLSGTFMMRQLRPWHFNMKKRLVKRPKIYFRDSGIFHNLLNVENKQQVLTHPKLGASWEGFILEEIIKHFQLKEDEVYYWRTHNGAELDLMFEKKGKRFGVEIKYTQAPQLTPSIRSALSELSLSHIWLIYPGEKQYPLHPRVTVVPLEKILNINL